MVHKGLIMCDLFLRCFFVGVTVAKTNYSVSPLGQMMLEQLESQEALRVAINSRSEEELMKAIEQVGNMAILFCWAKQLKETWPKKLKKLLEDVF